MVYNGPVARAVLRFNNVVGSAARAEMQVPAAQEHPVKQPGHARCVGDVIRASR